MKKEIESLQLYFRDYSGEILPVDFEYKEEDRDLIDFYNTDAQHYCEESISKVINVFHEEELVGYFAYAVSEINASHLQKNDRFAPFPHPAIKLGRLLICQSMRGMGIGTTVLKKVATIALDVREIVPIRFLIVDSMKQAVQFYLHNGFVDSGIKRGKQKDLSIMYIDLKNLNLT
ncbi:MAG: GNAT family N-acetyltransferase [bacterium]|nr:GNAT family N-acetyltransferase [bacterium]